ncbi:hypothetical protein CRI94_15115 [Longibacter salinarum]|uniref:histidine kinase n=1 Tax=Longibacter salinarum TaxID=1850348 RepID=A0A2A8CUE2_9BACT|nr:sensor histidine kinase [Longibacter salinarum]PEN11367.1 hypothetical protein CRI94_15115 [Longibacter salinarum]
MSVCAAPVVFGRSAGGGHRFALAGILFVMLITTGFGTAFGQSASERVFPQGLPHPVVHYDPDDTPAERQVWDIAQDSSRVVYVAGSHRGVQAFDGEHWLTIPIDSTEEGAAVGTARVVTQGHDGRMYVGSNDDIGVLEPDDRGVLRFRSLLPNLRASDRSPDSDGTGTVWFAGATDTYTYFQTQRAIYRWDGDALDVWRSDGTFHTAHLVDGRLFVRDFDRGLLELVGGILRPVSGGNAFQNRSIHFLALHPSGGMMAVTGSQGAYLVSEDGAQPVSIEADSILRTTRVYAGSTIRMGRGEPLYALATLGRGVIIMDSEGAIVYHLRPGHELPDGVVNAIHPGMQGEIWIGFNNEGVMRLGGLSRVKYYGERSGLRGQIEAIASHRGELYVGTGSGLFRMRKQVENALPLESTPFERVAGSSVVNGLTTTKWGLLVDDLSRAWMLGSDDEQIDILRRNMQTALLPSSHPDQLLLATMRGGLVIAENKGQTWSTSYAENADASIHSLAEYDGEIWAAVDPGTILRFRIDEGPEISAVRHMSLDPTTAVEGFAFTVVENNLLLVSRSGIYRWNEESGRFVQEHSLVPGDSKPVRTFRYVSDQKRAWLVAGERLYAGTIPEGDSIRLDAFEWTPVSGLSFPGNETVRLREASSGGLWIGRGDDLLFYDPQDPASSDEAPPVLVRRVVAGSEKTVVRGSRADRSAPLSLSHSMNSPVIQFAAPNFDAESPPLYRTRLIGRNAEWSDWSRRAEIGYPRLRERVYQFEIQARTVDGVTSTSSRLEFIVAPPWYRTTAAYVAYLLIIAGLAVSIWRYRVAVRRRRRAEERTSKTEAQLQAEQQVTQSLTRANERLRELNRMKEYFLANTSHELRTPLTNIIGFAQVLQDDVPHGVAMYLKLIEKNGYRLLHTLNAVLDLAGLRSGTIRPVQKWVDLRTPVNTVVTELSPNAEQKTLGFNVSIPDDKLYAYVDPHFVERIVHHLVDNAIKFTEEGNVGVELWRDDAEVGITVRDTGIGIDPAFMPNLFVGFEQQSRGMARAYEGSGIGLAVAGQLVDVMNGRIVVDSVEGEGSSFHVSFPRQDPKRERDEPPTAPQGRASSSASTRSRVAGE